MALASEIFVMLKTSQKVLTVNICVLVAAVVLGLIFHDFFLWIVVGTIYLLILDVVVLKKAQRSRKRVGVS